MTPEEIRQLWNSEQKDSFWLMIGIAEICERLDKLIATQPPKWKAGPR